MKDITYILRIKCPDAYGIVAKVSSSLNDMNIFIMDSSFFSDPDTKNYFMRLKIFSSEGEIKSSVFSDAFNNECSDLRMEWTLEKESKWLILNFCTQFLVLAARESGWRARAQAA